MTRSSGDLTAWLLIVHYHCIFIRVKEFFWRCHLGEKKAKDFVIGLTKFEELVSRVRCALCAVRGSLL